MRWVLNNTWYLKEKTSKWNWHTWFAWYSVILDNTIIWLEQVYRRYNTKVGEAGTFEIVTYFEYKLIKTNKEIKNV